MFKVTQSHRTEYLLDLLLAEYCQPLQDVFAEFLVIVPSMVLGDWLDKIFAERAGISTLVTTTFWGQYQWQLMQNVLDAHNAWLTQQGKPVGLSVPEVAVLSQAVMQWRVFGYLRHVLFAEIANTGVGSGNTHDSTAATHVRQSVQFDDQHPLYDTLAILLNPLLDTSQDSSNSSGSSQADTQLKSAIQNHSTHTDLNLDGTNTDHATNIESRLWQLASDVARMFARYLTYREDWLKRWSQGESIDVERLIQEKDELSARFDSSARTTPEWLTEHYVALETAQRHLWQMLFADIFSHRQSIEAQFWQALQANDSKVRQVLPQKLRLFTIQQLPPIELEFLQKLSRYTDIHLYHYNPSQLYWADIVDKRWLERQRFINPASVYLREHGHTLLSRLGKQSRETFAMLVDMAGNIDNQNDTVQWQDDFDNAILHCPEQQSLWITGTNKRQPTLLEQLQYDILMLDETTSQEQATQKVVQSLQLADIEKRRYEVDRRWRMAEDNSLSIHSCHSLSRQLEVLRMMIGRWLNEPNPDGSTRHLSDVVVLMPNVDKHHEVIRSVFVDGRGQDGLTLPAKITGVVDTSIRKLWQAITGFYRLLGVVGARFTAPEVFDWLTLEPLYTCFGLTGEQMRRGCHLLKEAGYIRGFDEAHLKQTLDASDTDYRFTFAHALDRLALGLVMPESNSTSFLYDYALCDHVNGETDSVNSIANQEVTRPLPNVRLSDAPIIEALCRLHEALHAHRFDYDKRKRAGEWLTAIEEQVIDIYFAYYAQTRQMRAIYNAMNGFRASLRANRFYEQNTFSDLQNRLADGLSHRLQDLPLKLPFMIDSIESTLESQQVSAEPTGVITFGRFGALRNVPFGLVVMLNMNLSEFPNRDNDNRIDLMQAGLARRGDRFSEDDDNGAFLDAMLCARSACWIFYNGRSLTDTYEHLPANPVSELIEFLTGKVSWQLPDDAQIQLNTKFDADVQPTLDNQAAMTLSVMPSIVKRWLVTQHPALPFDKILFTTQSSTDLEKSQHDLDKTEKSLQAISSSLNQLMDKVEQNRKSQLPPAQLWQAVYQQAYRVTSHITDNRVDGEQQTSAMLNLPAKQDYERLALVLQNPHAIHHDVKNFATIDIQQLAQTASNPAKQFLKANQVRIVAGQPALAGQEALELDGLTRYQVLEHLLQQSSHLTTLHLPKLSVDSQKVAMQNNEQSLYHQLQDILPAGVGRTASFQKLKQTMNQECQAFVEQLASMGVQRDLDNQTSSTERDADLSQQFISQLFIPLFTPSREQSALLSLSSTNLAPSENVRFVSPRIKAKVPIFLESVFNSQSKPNDTQDEGATSENSYEQSSASRQNIWLNVLPNSAQPKHLLKFWLLHLAWQIIRTQDVCPTLANQKEMSQQGGSQEDIGHNEVFDKSQTLENKADAIPEGTSIWRYFKQGSQLSDIKPLKDMQTFMLAPMSTEKACNELIKWIQLAKFSEMYPLILLPEYAMKYVYLKQENPDYHPTRKDFQSWLYPSHNADTIFESCVQHPLWQYVLAEEGQGDGFDAFDALTDALTTLSMVLYRPLLDALVPIDR